jgi:hypothetical protein
MDGPALFFPTINEGVTFDRELSRDRLYLSLFRRRPFKLNANQWALLHSIFQRVHGEGLREATVSLDDLCSDTLLSETSVRAALFNLRGAAIVASYGRHGTRSYTLAINFAAPSVESVAPDGQHKIIRAEVA